MSSTAQARGRPVDRRRSRASRARTTKNDDEVTPRSRPNETRVEQVARVPARRDDREGVRERRAVARAVPDDDVTVSGPTTDPSATPVGDSPSVPGVLRLNVEDVNEDLTDACGVAEGQDVRVYWTTDTSFDPSDVLDDLEDEIEDRVAGISGRVYRVRRRHRRLDARTRRDRRADRGAGPHERLALRDRLPVRRTTTLRLAERLRPGRRSDRLRAGRTAPTRAPSRSAGRRLRTDAGRRTRTRPTSRRPSRTRRDKPKKTPLSSATPHRRAGVGRRTSAAEAFSPVHAASYLSRQHQ